MKAARFTYFLPNSLNEALAHLQMAKGNATILAGGQSLVPLMARRLTKPSTIVDINRLTELGEVTRTAQSTIVGAMVRQNQLLTDPNVADHVPALAIATRLVGHHQTRNRGTIGGSIAFGEPAAELPAVSLALNAVVHVRSSKATRIIPIGDFYVGPYLTNLQADELVVAIEYPDWPEGTRFIVREITQRSVDIALVGLVCGLTFQQRTITGASIVWFGMGPKPLRSAAAEESLLGKCLNELDPRFVAELAIEETRPGNERNVEGGYRIRVGRYLLTRALVDLLGGTDVG